MFVDGRSIAELVYEETRAQIARLGRVPRLAIITCAPNFETQRYLALKQKKAAAVGIETTLNELPPESTTKDVLDAVLNASADGIVVQLPLPPQIDTNMVLRSIPTIQDVDALNPETTHVLSPVVGALKVILEHHGVSILGKHVVVLGNGRLVGMPAATWFQNAGALVETVTRDTKDVSEKTKIADIIVCGAGVPGLLTPDMIKEGAIILDGGTSEAGGKLHGDADPSCSEKATLFTPVPGGIGPITIAILLQNVVVLAGKGSIVV